MSTVGVILIVIGAILLVLFAGGLLMSARRRARPGAAHAIREADRALARAAAADRGWDRTLLEAAATRALNEERPGYQWTKLELVLVDDRPGVVEDHAHLLATSPDGDVRVVLARDADGQWLLERVE